jgi:hypothetical protein
MTLAKQIQQGMELSFDQKVIETANQFMDDNGFKRTETGKLLACNYVEDMLADDPVLSTAVQMAIVSL